MRTILLSIFTILISFTFFSCENATETEKQEQPSVPVLVYPAEQAVDVSTDVKLEWTASSDPNGDAIEYTVHYCKPPANWKVAGKTKDTNYKMNLDEDSDYYWYISATDGQTNSVDSETRSFKTLYTNIPPVASFTVSQPGGGLPGSNFEFDASDCSDEEDSATDLQVRWDFDGDNNWDISWSTNKLQTFKYNNVGTYTVKMEVKDSFDDTAITTCELIVSLFNPSVYNCIPASYYQDVFLEDFDNNQNNWPLGDTDDYIANIHNGYYEMTNLQYMYHHLFNVTVDNLNEDWNFEIETRIKIKVDEGEDYHWTRGSLIWGGIYDNGYSYYEFGANAYKEVTICDRSHYTDTWDTWSDGWQESVDINEEGSYNKLTVRKYDGQYFFFINEVLIKAHQFKTFYGNRIGFLNSPSCTTSVDYLHVYALGSSKLNISPSNSKKAGICVEINAVPVNNDLKIYSK